jgi:hypothetical protein
MFQGKVASSQDMQRLLETLKVFLRLSERANSQRSKTFFKLPPPSQASQSELRKVDTNDEKVIHPKECP